MKLLNPGYNNYTGQLSIPTNNSLYWNSGSGECFNGQTNSKKSCDFTSTGLKDSAKNMISTAYWNLGGHNNSSTVLSTAADSGTFLNKTLYSTNERGTTKGGSGGALGWTGKVALIYPSDYAYGGYNCNKDYPLYKDDGTDVRKCNDLNWLRAGTSGSDEWLLSPSSNDAIYAWSVYSTGGVRHWHATAYGHAVRPAVYLKSDINIIDGSGTEEDPYILEEATTNMKLSKYLKKIAPNNSDTMFYDGTPEIEETKGNNLRYYGANPNNYVTFNGETAGWRIIGVFDGKVKLVRRNSIGSYSWDYKSNGTYSNNWSQSTLKELLNSGAYYNRTTGTYYNNSTTASNVDFSSNGLTSNAKNMISSNVWYLGSYTWKGENGGLGNLSNKLYQLERGNLESGAGGGLTVNAKVGLIYPSDYGYSSKDCYNTKPLRVVSGTGDYRDDDCRNSNWLLWAGKELSITAYHSDTMGIWALYSFSSSGLTLVEPNSNTTDYGVRPTIYLDSNVQRVSGTGSSTDPYVLNDSDYAE